MSKKPIFKDPDLQIQYLRDGYVILPFLNAQEVKDMLKLHDITHDDFDTLPNCYNTSDDVTSIEKKRKVKNEIEKTVQPCFDKYLNDFKIVYANFIGKKPGNKSNRDLHQDYSFCDEDNYDSYNVWIPLHDITEKNSYFSIVRNSYQFFKSYRGRFLRHRFEKSSVEIMEKFCTNLFPKAGHAIIYNTGSLHYTPDNISTDNRIAISLMIIPSEAQINLYQTKENDTSIVERYEVDEEFLMNYPAWKRIEGLEPVNVSNYDNSEVSFKDFKKFYYKYNKDVKPNIFQQLLMKLGL